MHAENMTTKMVQIRNMPDRLHRRLKERAAREGKSLSGYLLEELERIAAQPSMSEWLDELHTHPRARLDRPAADYVREGREERDAP